MNRNPSTLLCQESVLQRMDVNKRFQLVSRCPALRTAHRNTPARIESLNISSFTLTVNRIEHKFLCFSEGAWAQMLGLISHGTPGQPPGGHPYDLDENGNRDEELHLEQGDILARDPEQSRSHERFLQESLATTAKQLRLDITNYVKYYCGTTEHRLRDGVKLRDAIRNLLKDLVPRNSFVKKLEISEKWSAIRVPNNYRIRVEEVNLASIFLNPGFLDPASFPLKKLQVEIDYSRDFKNPIIKKSEILELYTIHESRFANKNLIPLIVRFDHPNILLQDYPITRLPIRIPGAIFRSREFPPEVFVGLHRAWVDNPRDLRSKLSIPYANDTRFKEIFDRIRGDRVVIPTRSCPEFPRAKSFQIGTHTELNVYVMKVDEDEKPWRIVMEVMESGSAENREFF